MTRADEVADRVIQTVAETAPQIRRSLREFRGTALEEENASGDTVIGADVHADELLTEPITSIDGVGQYASEERDAPMMVGDGVSVTVDPLDGSSNVATNHLVGTIVGVYDAPLPARGRDLVGAAYVVYGPITTMVVAVDGLVTELAVTPDGPRTLERNVTLPEDPTVYGFGGRVPDWPDSFSDFVAEIESELKLRYGGSMVGDVNQVLKYGGIFAYPALRDAPSGKLRLQFEANPMAYIIEAAGGRSSTGMASILDAEPADLHQRVPTHLGNAELIRRLEDRLG